MVKVQLLICTKDVYVWDTTLLIRNQMLCYLNRGWAEGKQLISGSLCVSVHVDQNVDSILVNTISCLAIAGNLERCHSNSINGWVLLPLKSSCWNYKSVKNTHLFADILRNKNTDTEATAGHDSYLWEVCEMVSLCYHFHTEVGTVIRAKRIAEHLGEGKEKKRGL